MNAPEAYAVLVIDAGHTRIKFALCRAQSEQPLPVVEQFTAVMLGESLPWDLLRTWTAIVPACRTLVTGSNPVALQDVLAAWPSGLPTPRLLPERRDLPIVCDVEFPERVGIDRLLTAIATNRLRGPKQTAIVVDTGTAITVDALGSTGIFYGGAILPGVRMGSQALHRYTATLPEIDASTLFTHTPNPIGRNTQAAIESGLYWGHVGAVRELILRQRDRLASFDKAKDSPSLLLFTGGAAPLLAPHFGQGRFEPHLALQGLAVVAAATTGSIR